MIPNGKWEKHPCPSRLPFVSCIISTTASHSSEHVPRKWPQICPHDSAAFIRFGLVWFIIYDGGSKIARTTAVNGTTRRKKKRSCVGRKHKNAIAFSSRWLLTADEIPIASWITRHWRRKERTTQCTHTHTARDTLAILFSPLLVLASPLLLLPLCWECACTQQWAEVFVVFTSHDGFNYVETNNNEENDRIARKINSLSGYSVYSLHSSSSRQAASAPASFVDCVYADGHWLSSSELRKFIVFGARTADSSNASALHAEHMLERHLVLARSWSFLFDPGKSVRKSASVNSRFINIEIRYLNTIPVSVPRVASLLPVQSFRGWIRLARLIWFRCTIHVGLIEKNRIMSECIFIASIFTHMLSSWSNWPVILWLFEWATLFLSYSISRC